MQPPHPQHRRRSNVKGVCYLLHFSQPVGHAQHYLGWANGEGLFKRLSQHESGNGAATPVVRALIKQGGYFELARTWRDVDRFFERRLKNRGGKARMCPICKTTNGEES